MIKSGVLGSSPEEVALFFLSCKLLDKPQIGEFIGDQYDSPFALVCTSVSSALLLTEKG